MPVTENVVNLIECFIKCMAKLGLFTQNSTNMYTNKLL